MPLAEEGLLLRLANAAVLPVVQEALGLEQSAQVLVDVVDSAPEREDLVVLLGRDQLVVNGDLAEEQFFFDGLGQVNSP